MYSFNPCNILIGDLEYFALTFLLRSSDTWSRALDIRILHLCLIENAYLPVGTGQLDY